MIEPETFEQITNLDTETILDLVNTVCLAIRHNPNLTNNPQSKIRIALLMMDHIIDLFEKCDSRVAIFIDNPSLLSVEGILYKTGHTYKKGDVVKNPFEESND